MIAARPLFSLVAAGSFALGIGANTAIFSLWNSVVRAPLPGVSDPGSLVMLTNPAARGTWRGRWVTAVDGPRAWLTYGEFELLRDRARSFTSLMASGSPLETWQGRVDAGVAEPVSGRLVSGGFFDVLGVVPAAGRLFSGEHDAGSRPEAVISYAFWQRRLQGRLDAIGRTITIRDTPLTVVGVAPAGFTGESAGQRPDMWLPLRLQPVLLPGADWLHEQPPDKVMWLHVFGRLKRGVTAAQAETESNTILQQHLASFYGAGITERQGLLDQRLRLQSGARGVSSTLEQFASSVSTLFAALAILLVIGCANIAHLLLARGMSRRGELAIRLSLGATRRQLVHLVFVEGAVLAATGGLMATVVAGGLHAALVRLFQASEPELGVAFGLDLPVLLFTSLATFVAAVASSILPAWHLSQTDGGVVLSDARRGTAASKSELRSGRWVVGMQLALSVPLLVGAGLLVQTILNLRQPDLGFRSEGLYLARVNLGGLVQDPPRRDRALRAVVQRLQTTPGIEQVSFSQLGLLNPGAFSSADIEVDGSIAPAERSRESAVDRVGPGYFSALGIPLRAGRDIDARDSADAPKVAVVNAAFAARHFGTGVALGREIAIIESGGERTRYAIVGVAADAHTHALRGAVEPRFFVSSEQRRSIATARTLLIRTHLGAGVMQARLREAVAAADREMTIIEALTIPSQVVRLTTEERALAQLATAFGVVAVTLAALGLYGVLAFGVARRTQEIAVRVALGADARRVVRMILWESLALVVSALAAGSVLAVLASSLLRSQLYGVTARDPVTLAAAAALLLAVAAIAVYVPARRASRVEPMAALRQA